MLGTKYVGRHRVLEEKTTTVFRVVKNRWTRRVLVPVSVFMAIVLGFGSSAFASPVQVRAGDTFSGLVAKHCGTSNWQGVSFPGRNKNLIYAGETIDITCATSTASASVPAVPAASNRAQAVVNFALSQVGKPYVWAASGPWSYDCSGLVLRSYAQIGIHLPHNDQAILHSGKGWPVSRANLQPGDVVWPYVGHVFIYIGNGKIVESGRGGVKVNNLYAFWTARRYV